MLQTCSADQCAASRSQDHYEEMPCAGLDSPLHLLPAMHQTLSVAFLDATALAYAPFQQLIKYVCASGRPCSSCLTWVSGQGLGAALILL